MRRYAILLGLTAAIAGVTAVPAAAHTITPATHDYGRVPLQKQSPLVVFTVKAEGAHIPGEPAVISGNSNFSLFVMTCQDTDGLRGLYEPYGITNGSYCQFGVKFYAGRSGSASAVVGFPSGPTATVTARVAGKKKGCKKGKKGAAGAAKKKGCKK